MKTNKTITVKIIQFVLFAGLVFGIVRGIEGFNAGWMNAGLEALNQWLSQQVWPLRFWRWGAMMTLILVWPCWMKQFLGQSTVPLSRQWQRQSRWRLVYGCLAFECLLNSQPLITELMRGGSA